MNYYISGSVTHGEKYGRKLGYPTANLETDDEIPKSGVYSGIAVYSEKEYRAGIVIGPEGKVEAHLIGFTGDLYGQEITIEIEKFIRDYKNFDTEEELKAQIKKDLEQC